MEYELYFDGFSITAYFYKFLLINISGVYINLTLLNIYINHLMLKEIFKYNDYINLYVGLLYIIPAIFFSHLSKEIPIFLLIYIAVFTLQKYKYIKYLPLIFIAIFIRNYWLIIIINIIIISIFAKSILAKFIYLIISNTFFVVIYEAILNQNTSDIRDALTNPRIGAIHSDSIISNLNYLNSGILNDLINYYYSILIIIAPFIVVNQLKLQYLILTFIQIFIIINILKINWHKFSKSETYCLNIIISTLMTIIIFEPDLGSFSRHEFILFPFLAYLFNKNYNSQ
jgi:hypothetical protein